MFTIQEMQNIIRRRLKYTTPMSMKEVPFAKIKITISAPCSTTTLIVNQAKDSTDTTIKRVEKVINNINNDEYMVNRDIHNMGLLLVAESIEFGEQVIMDGSHPVKYHTFDAKLIWMSTEEWDEINFETYKASKI